MSFGGGGIGGPVIPPKPKRKVEGTPIPALGITIRHYYAEATDFSEGDGQTHEIIVPQGRFWRILGGIVYRNACTATLEVGIYTPNNVRRRRLNVAASGASDYHDIPDHTSRNRINEMLAELEKVRCYFNADQRGTATDSFIKLSVIEAESK